MRTSRSESGNGSGRRITALITVNIARFPPMPILSESVAVSQNIGAERRFLYARRIASPIGFPLNTLIGLPCGNLPSIAQVLNKLLTTRPGRGAALFDCETPKDARARTRSVRACAEGRASHTRLPVGAHARAEAPASVTVFPT